VNCALSRNTHNILAHSATLYRVYRIIVGVCVLREIYWTSGVYLCLSRLIRTNTFPDGYIYIYIILTSHSGEVDEVGPKGLNFVFLFSAFAYEIVWINSTASLLTELGKSRSVTNVFPFALAESSVYRTTFFYDILIIHLVNKSLQYGIVDTDKR